MSNCFSEYCDGSNVANSFNDIDSNFIFNNLSSIGVPYLLTILEGLNPYSSAYVSYSDSKYDCESADV